jgi:uncharacterized membrane protein (UPF0127 family)
MNSILENYLSFLNEDTSEMMDKFLSDFKNIITFTDSEELQTGLLKYKEKPPKGTIFVFEFPKEEVLNFHTIGMKFPIKISFWNSDKEVVYVAGVIKPGVKNISSMQPAKYVIEEPV